MNEMIQLKLEPKDINFFNRIIEGYEYLGTVTTLDARTGIVVVRTTPDFYDEVLRVIENLDLDIQILRD